MLENAWGVQTPLGSFGLGAMASNIEMHQHAKCGWGSVIHCEDLLDAVHVDH